TVGYLYFRIALLIAALMAGMALGVLYGNAMIKRTAVGAFSLRRCHLVLVVTCVLLSLVFLLLPKISAPWLSEPLLMLCAVGAGFAGAAVFPVSNRIYFSSRPDSQRRTGVIYSADLAGSCFGALLPSAILIPVFGIYKTLIFIALANLLMLSLPIVSHKTFFVTRR
ncbi:MAG: hypothetical protein V2A66_09245, partial [Pseudomonadota bacterium]